MAEQAVTEKLIIVTGFGPFVNHEQVNASWEAVKLLPDDLQYKDCTYKIIKYEVPVEYECVDKVVEEIWKQNPEVVIHCGVHGRASTILLERLAYNNKFKRPDYGGNYLKYGKACVNSCVPEEGHVIKSNIDVTRIVSNVTKKYTMDENGGCDDTTPFLTCSNDVGAYLCGYIYLKSLDINRNRSLFIHVPPIDKPFSSEFTAEVIYVVIKECLEQLQECEGSAEKKVHNTRHQMIAKN